MSIWEKILSVLGLIEEDKDDEFMEPGPGKKQFWKKGNVVDFPSLEENYRLIVSSPASFAEVEGMGGQLKNKRPVVVNLENMDAEEAKRTVVFLSGVVFALNGSSQKIGQDIFVFAPAGVALNSDFQSRLSSERDLLLTDTDE